MCALGGLLCCHKRLLPKLEKVRGTGGGSLQPFRRELLLGLGVEAGRSGLHRTCQPLALVSPRCPNSRSDTAALPQPGELEARLRGEYQPSDSDDEDEGRAAGVDPGEVEVAMVRGRS